MSPSSVCDDSIKGVNTDALSHLGPNVGKPVQRWGQWKFCLLNLLTIFSRLRYYNHIQRCVDFFYKPCEHCRTNPFLGHQRRCSPQHGEITGQSTLLRRISWSGLSLLYHWRRCLTISSLKISCGPMWSLFTSGLIHCNTISRLLWFRSSLGAEGVLPGRQIESFVRVFKQFTLNLPRG